MSIKGKGKKANIASGILLAMSLLGLGGMSTQGSTYENLSSLIGSAIGGLGALAIKKAGDKKGSGKKHEAGEHHKKMIHEIMKNDKAIHVDELKFSEEKKEQLSEKLESHKGRIQSGSGVFSNLKKAAKKFAHKASHELKLFVQGKKKLQPSQLMNYLAASVGIAGAASALIPGINLITVPTAGAISLGLKSVSTALGTSGRGIDWSKIVPEIIGIVPKRYHATVKKYPEKIIELSKMIQKQNGSGLKLTGQGKVKEIMKNLSLVGLTASGVMSGLYLWLQKHPEHLVKIISTMGPPAMRGIIKASVQLAREKAGGALGPVGSGLKLAGQGEKTVRRGKIQSRDVVYNNPQGKYRTSGGLYKDDLMKNPKSGKIISKKKYAIGKALYAKHGSKLKKKKQ